MAECPAVLGLKVLYEGPKPCVDIVAVHGLGASPDWAWIRKVKDGDKEVKVNWLADENMLPAKLPNSRIMTFNYESKWLLGAPKQRCSLCAIQLLTALDSQRKEARDTKYRPLIFIGHSFGGVVIQQSLVSASPHGDSYQYLAMSTVGVIFLGTPHRGTQAARWGQIAATAAKALGLGFEDSILKNLREDSEHSRDLLYDFTLWANRAALTLICFFEQYKTDYGKRLGITWKELVVDEFSACIDGYRKVPLPTDHLKINKYSGPHDPSYTAVFPFIVDMALNAERIAQGRLNPQKLVEDNSGTKKVSIPAVYISCLGHTGIPPKNLECLQFLYLSNPQDDLAAIRSAKGERVPGTCEWILTRHQYTTWLVEDGPQLLWLSGGPGIGKTMISSFLVEELVQLAGRSPQTMFAYYFCDAKDEKRRNATAILRGLLLQLLRQRPIFFKHIQSRFDMSRDSLFTDFHALWRVFVSIVQDTEAGEVCCLIDALDECEKDSRQPFLTNLVELFGPRHSKKTFSKFIVTSRRENDIEGELLCVDHQSIQDLHVVSGNVDCDLSKFIDIKVDQLSASRKFRSKNTVEEIKRTLTEKAGGTFLYVSLVLNELKNTPESRIHRKLQEWPSELNKIYDKILSQIEGGCEDIVKTVLSWVVVARRPLKIREIATACHLSSEGFKHNTISTVDLDKHESDFEWCRSFVYVDKINGTVNLVHQSAKDYLLGAYLQANTGLSQYHIDLDTTNLRILRTCWRHLGLKEFEQGTVIVRRDPDHKLDYSPLSQKTFNDHCFLQYTIQEWRKHALAAGPALTADREFWKDNLNRLPNVRDFWLLQAAAEGQEVVVQRLLEEGVQPNPLDCYCQTPLARAAEKGFETIVRLLLGRDDIIADSRDVLNRTPLLRAVKGKYDAIVRLLLSRDDVVANSPTLISLAFQKEFELVTRQLLSRNDFPVNSRDVNGQTLLSVAAEKGLEMRVKLLLSRGDVVADSRDKRSGRKRASYTAWTGHGLDFWPERRGRTPLSYAAQGGYESIVRLLLSRKDVTADSQDEDGRTPLYWAAMRGHEVVVRLLLSQEDVIADTRDKWALTPRSRAAVGGYEPVVRLLLSRTDVVADSRDNEGRTPLSRAAGGGHMAVVRLLLSQGDVAADSQDNMGQTPLSWAAMVGDELVVRLLLSRTDVVADSRDKEGRTPLWWAAYKNHKAVVRILEEKMREINSPSRKRQIQEVLDD